MTQLNLPQLKKSYLIFVLVQIDIKIDCTNIPIVKCQLIFSILWIPLHEK